MGKKIKVKVKRGKVKITLKSGDESLPLSVTDVRVLLANSLASALAQADDRSAGRLTKTDRMDPARSLPQGSTTPVTDLPEAETVDPA